MTQTVGYPQGNGLLSGSATSQPLQAIGQNVLAAPADQALSGGEVLASLNNSLSGPFSLFGHQANTAAANFSFLLQQPGLAPFVGFRPVYVNFGAAQTITLAKAAVAPTKNNNGAALTWVNLLFGGAAAGAQPAGSGAGADIVPGILLGDWVPLSSIPRTDFPSRLPLAQVRTQYALGSSHRAIFANAMSDYEALTGMEFATNVSAGDLVTTPTTPFVPTAAGTWMCPIGIDFAYGIPTYTVADVGDSLMRGQESGTTSVGWYSPSQRACDARRTSTEIWQAATFALTGQTHAASYLTGLEVVSKLKPRYLCFRAWSPNDGAPTQALMDAAWQRTIALIEHCRVNGVRPVVCTTPPRNSLTPAQDTLLKAQNARVLSVASFVVVSNEAVVVEDPSNRAQLLPAYNSGDGLHLTAAGYAAMAAVRQRALPA